MAFAGELIEVPASGRLADWRSRARRMIRRVVRHAPTFHVTAHRCRSAIARCRAESRAAGLLSREAAVAR